MGKCLQRHEKEKGAPCFASLAKRGIPKVASFKIRRLAHLLDARAKCRETRYSLLATRDSAPASPAAFFCTAFFCTTFFAASARFRS